MKKLMFAAAAIVAGVAVADVTSANVVGYANDTLKASKWKSVCSQFLKIGSEDGSDMVLGDLKVGGGWVATSDAIKVINENAGVEFQATYLPEWSALNAGQKRAAGAAGRTEANWVPGWYAYDASNKLIYTADKNSTPLPFGTCVLVSAAATGTYVTSSGEVVQPEDGKIISTLVASQWKFVGNCTPVALTLGDFKVANGWVATSDAIKVINENAGVEFQATYLPEWNALNAGQKRAAGAAGRTEANWVPGWYAYDASNKLVYTADKNSTPIPAGSGILVSAAATGVQVIIPSAL